MNAKFELNWKLFFLPIILLFISETVKNIETKERKKEMPPKQQKKQQQNSSKGSGTSSTSSRDTYGKSVLNRAENGNPIFAVTLALPSRTSATTSQSQEISSTASAMSGGAAICMMNSFSMEAEGIGLGDIILVYDKAKPFADSMFSAVTVWPSKYVLRGCTSKLASFMYAL